jgi:hypothetical protein
VGSDAQSREKQQHKREKVSGLREAMAAVRSPIDGVAIKLSQTDDAVERRVRPPERAVLGLAEMQDRMSRVESDIAGLRAAMAAGDARELVVFRRKRSSMEAIASVYHIG